jgi:alkanesulfonate monooxygenase SsuD/methylene tetrahydromethanopterin reductase-like flavin-dependent oxidoreductase (luciferase family)
MVALGFVAGCTERIHLHTNVVPVINRDPASLAKQIASLDQLSDGRVELGLGVGWLREEAKALGNPTELRLDRLSEVIDILRLAWTSESFEYSGAFYDYEPLGIHPHPVQGGELPIWIGTSGRGSKALRLAAEKCTGVSMWLIGTDDVARIRRQLDETNPAALIAVGMSVGGDVSRAEVEAHAHALCEVGVDHLILAYFGDFESSLPAFRWFSSLSDSLRVVVNGQKTKA